MLKNKVLNETFGPKREVIRGWRKLHDEEPHDLYSLPNIKSGRMKSVEQMHV